MRFGSLNIHHPVVCDHIRKEDTGKFILLGVYHGGVLLQQLPANLILSFYIPFTPDQSGDFDVSFKLLGPTNEECASGVIACRNILKGIDGVVTINDMVCRIESAGVLRLQVKLAADEDFRTIRETTIEARPLVQQ